jgi:hypothetical protein
MFMEFFIRKNATLPVLEINLFKDGRLDYNYQNTNLTGATITSRYMAEFNITTDQGTITLPLRDKIYVTVLDSFVNSDFCCGFNW